MNSMQSKTLRWFAAAAAVAISRGLFERRRADGGQPRHDAHLRSPTTPARPRPTPTCRPSASTCGRTSRLTTVAARCHNAGGQTPMFARNDDVNLAYQAANTVVNLTQPDQSRLVTKVASGHNCWLQSPSACGDTMTVWIRNWAGASATGGTQIQLQAPAIREVGGSKSFPAMLGALRRLVSVCDWCATPPRRIACAAIPRTRPRSSSRSSPKAPPRRPCRRAGHRYRLRGHQVEDQSRQSCGFAPGRAPARRVPQLLGQRGLRRQRGHDARQRSTHSPTASTSPTSIRSCSSPRA